MPRLLISARLAPLPPSNSFMSARPSATSTRARLVEANPTRRPEPGTPGTKGLSLETDFATAGSLADPWLGCDRRH
jgi:hypothetical protein